MSEKHGMKALVAGLIYGAMASPTRFRDTKADSKETGLAPA